MPGDKLELYALLLMLAQITPQMILMLYARRTYPDCALHLPPTGADCATSGGMPAGTCSAA